MDEREMEEKVRQAYALLKELSLVQDHPCVRQNARRALASVWQIVNDLGLEYVEPVAVED